MSVRVAIIAIAFLTQSLPSMAQHYESPEAALAEYIAAYKARDVARFLACIDFTHEAREKLSRRPGQIQTVSDTEVQATADGLETELKEHFAKFGFKAESLDNCREVTKFQDTETQVRIILSCTDSRGSTTFPVRVLRFAQGWRIVRGG